MAVRYQWRPGSRISIDAEKAGRELTRIEKAEGALTPEAVLSRARSANSSLHGHFEWDDTKAAEHHRLAQAGELIRSITIDVTKSNVEPARQVRAFLNVTQADARHYVSSATAMGDAELRLQVLAKAWADLEAWRRRYADLTELGNVFAVIDAHTTP